MSRMRSLRDNRARYDIGALEQRVYGLEKGISDLAQNTAAQFAAQRQDTTQQIANVEKAIGSLGAKLDERGKPQWMLMVSIAGFMLAFVTAVGTLAYLPIKTTSDKLETEVQKLRGDIVPRAEQTDRRTVVTERFDRLERDIARLGERVVPRGELSEKWRAHDDRFADLQRQLDDQKKAFGDTFSLRDALQQMQRRIDFLERRPQG